jgi:hypothetical protein
MSPYRRLNQGRQCIEKWHNAPFDTINRTPPAHASKKVGGSRIHAVVGPVCEPASVSTFMPRQARFYAFIIFIVMRTPAAHIAANAMYAPPADLVFKARNLFS